MKRIFICVVSVVMLICLAGCVPSNVKEVNKLIDSIGEVNMDSLETIDEANQKYEALTEEEKGQVEEYDTLKDANEKLNNILYAEIKILIEDSDKIEDSFFANYYDTKMLVSAKSDAQTALDNSDCDKYIDSYKKLKKEVKGFNSFVNEEKKKSFSKETNDGEYPFAVKESDIEYGMVLTPYEKMSSDYPYNVAFIEADTTDDLPILDFRVKKTSGIYSFKLRQIDTRWIEVRDQSGKLQKAFVNTELVLSDAPASWDPDNSSYPLGKEGCFIFATEDGITLAIKDLVNNKGYILYSL